MGGFFGGAAGGGTVAARAVATEVEVVAWRFKGGPSSGRLQTPGGGVIGAVAPLRSMTV